MCDTTLPVAQRLPIARAMARRAMPYFTRGIDSMIPVRMDGMGSMGVGRGGELFYDPEWLGRQTPGAAGSVILHEWMHLFLRHADRCDALIRAGVLRDTPADRRLSNIAADLEINDNLFEATAFERPTATDGSPEGVLPSEHDLPSHLAYEEYVRLLLARRDGELPSPSLPSPCGSGAGNPLPDEPALPPEDRRTQADQAIVTRACAEAARTAGSLPGTLARYVDALVGPPVVDWRQELADMAGGVSTATGARSDYTFTRPNRRSADGFFAPSMIGRTASVVFAIDTSGSMTDEVLQRLIGEVTGVLEQVPGVELTVIACDAKVHAMERVTDVSQVRKLLRGGGGTDFRPVFSALSALDTQPDLLVFGTDGFGVYPAPPTSFEVIWLNVGGTIAVDWGRVVDVPVG